MSSDSDSDSLPSLADLLGIPKTRTPTEISAGDIVWAKYKRLYWPALVRKIYKKEKKMTIWYADEPGKCFKLPFSKIFSFKDSVMTKKIKEEAEEAGVIEAHDGLTSHAWEYLYRRAEGYNDDPMKYFDQTYPFFLMENWLKQNPEAAKDTAQNIKIPPLYISHKSVVPVISKRKQVALNSTASDESSDIESVSTDNDSDADVPNTNWRIKEEVSDSFGSNYVCKIIDCIKSKKADEYLENIFSKKITSTYEKFYEESIHSKKQNLSSITYGPVKDMAQMRELINYLLDFFDHMPHKNEINKFEKGQYVSYVWLPESIIFAISEIHKISISEAKNIFQKFDSNIATAENIFNYTSKDIKLSEDGITMDDLINNHKGDVHENNNPEHKNIQYDLNAAKALPIKECVVVLHDCISEINNEKSVIQRISSVNTRSGSKVSRQTLNRKRRKRVPSEVSNVKKYSRKK